MKHVSSDDAYVDLVHAFKAQPTWIPAKWARVIYMSVCADEKSDESPYIPRSLCPTWTWIVRVALKRY